MKKKKWIIGGLLFVLILGGLGYGVYYKNSIEAETTAQIEADKKVDEQRQLKQKEEFDELVLADNTLRSLEISNVSTSPPNNAGGVDVTMTYANNSSKEIKYIKLTTCFLNAVDDVISSEIGGKNKFVLNITGPVKPKKSKYVNWSNVIYNQTTKKIRILEISVEYMDGTNVVIPKELLPDYSYTF